MLSCPKCKRVMMEDANDGGVKLRARMLLFKEDGTYAICPECKMEVSVPVVLHGTDSKRQVKHYVTG